MSLPKIFVIGDSISIHYGPFLEAQLKGFFSYARKSGEEAALKNLDIPEGANGGDSGMVLRYLKLKLSEGGIDADLLLLNCGLHDIKTTPATGAKQIPLDAYRQNLLQIIALMPQLGPKLVWIRTTPCDERVHNARQTSFHRFAADCNAYNAAADAIMREHGVPMIDLHGFTTNLGENLYCDHVHFPEPIRQQQAAFIAGWLCAAATCGMIPSRRPQAASLA